MWSRISAGVRCSPCRSIQDCRRGSLQSSNLPLPPPWTHPSPPASSSACGLRGTAPTAALPGLHGAAAPLGCSQCTSPPAWGNLELQPVIRERVWQAPLTHKDIIFSFPVRPTDMCSTCQPRPPTQKHVAGDKVLTCICNTMLYSGLMIQHFSTWVDVKNKFESEAVRLISTSYILEIDSSLFQMTLNLR